MSNKSKRNLYLLTDSFPYGRGEKSFIMPELPYLQERFCVTIISCATQKDRQNQELETALEPDIQVAYCEKEAVKGLEVLRYLFAFVSDRKCWGELKRIFTERKLLLRRTKACLFFYANAIKFKRWLTKSWLLDENGLYYSYWYNYHVMSLIMLRKSVGKIITRAHGYDLYEDRAKYGWQPYKRLMDQNVDRVVFISKHGYDYYMEHFAFDKDSIDKYYVCRLGTAKQESKDSNVDRDFFLLVSCSRVILVKRVWLIVRALSKINSYQIKWVHFGDGDLLEEVRMDAEKLLGNKDNIVFEFKGSCSNQEVLSYYRKNVPDAIIMTSKSEGSPVALQEALSFGIPIIATAVGGIPELIDSNGILLAPNPSTVQIADAIVTLCEMDKEKLIEMKERSLEMWRKDYNIDDNMRGFINCLEELVGEK